MRISGFGIRMDLPDGWDARVWKAPEGPEDVPGSSTPALHAANFALPSDDADFGSSSLREMYPGTVFIALKEFGKVMVGRPGFSERFAPPFDARRFRPENAVFAIPGRGAFQLFFSMSQRAFCLYVVAWMPIARDTLRAVNESLATLVVDEPSAVVRVAPADPTQSVEPPPAPDASPPASPTAQAPDAGAS